MRLSIIVPGIRIYNWQKLYCSIDFSQSWEIIFVGPNPPPFHLSTDIKYIESWRSPNACQQQALCVTQGEYITFVADDGVFLPNALDDAFEKLRWVNSQDILSGKEIAVGKYLEGANPQNMESDDYYYFKYHKTYRLKGVPQDDLIFNCGIISRDFICELGGWDCQFEATTMAHADLGIRAQKRGAEMVLMDRPMFQCSHEPRRTGTHAPIHEAMKRDIKRFSKIYKEHNDRMVIDIDNWKNTPERWKERFK